MSVKHLDRFYANRYEKKNEEIIERWYIKYNNHVIVKPLFIYFKILLFCILKCLKKWFNYIRSKTLRMLKMAIICYQHDKYIS